MRALALRYLLESIMQRLCTHMIIYLCVCVRIIERDRETKKNSRGQGVRNELSLSRAVCTCVFVGLRVCVWFQFSCGRFGGIIQMGTDVTGPTHLPSPASRVTCNHREKEKIYTGLSIHSVRHMLFSLN